MKEETFHILLNSIIKATSLIEPRYFSLPVTYSDSINRERNYCYELYRHIRNNLPNNLDYTFSGEVDKSGHPLITPYCGNVNPDFLLHRPGNMGIDDNHTVVEVKTFKGATIKDESKGFLKDINTINCMKNNIQNGYYRGILLVFGYADYLKKRDLIRVFHERCDVESTTLIFHESPLESAIIVS